MFVLSAFAVPSDSLNGVNILENSQNIQATIYQLHIFLIKSRAIGKKPLMPQDNFLFRKNKIQNLKFTVGIAAYAYFAPTTLLV
ncbi:hypothetical protein A1D24_05785 [Testudinibacter aquarius]|nr:hypothetical protein A1D24_05785 [Testudinibacter aquarius]